MSGFASKSMLRSLMGDLRQSLRLYFSPLRAVRRDLEASVKDLTHDPPETGEPQDKPRPDRPQGGS
jgi:hypothetical protein